ncbi:MAG: acyl carrier protein, partial [Pseudonocardiaceae bacterium]
MNNSDQALMRKVIETIVDIAEVPAEKVTPDKHLINELEFDSLTMAEMVVALQEIFGVELANEDMQYIATVRDVADYLQRRGVTHRDA